MKTPLKEWLDEEELLDKVVHNIQLLNHPEAVQKLLFK